MPLTCACIALQHVIVGKMPDSDVYSIYASNIKQILYSFEIIITMYFCNVSIIGKYI